MQKVNQLAWVNKLKFQSGIQPLIPGPWAVGKK